MKRILFAVYFICGAILLSCNKIIDDVPSVGEMVLTVSCPLDPTATKASGGESSISRLDVLVFRKDGLIDAYCSKTNPVFTDGKCNLQLNCTKATEMTVCVFANSKADISAKTLNEYKAILSQLSDNSESSFQMAGMKEDVNSASASVSVSLSRFMSKVQIDKISNNYARAITIDAVYLINVNTSCPYSLLPASATESAWLNQCRYSSCSLDSFLYKSVGKSIASAASLSDSHVFYAYPNPVVSDVSGGTVFSPRRTRLVVEATMDGEKTYYPVNIVGDGGTMNPNTIYRINELKISGRGSSDPDIVPDRGSLSIDVSIVDWLSGFSKTVEY